MTDENGSKNFFDGHLTVFHNNMVYVMMCFSSVG